MEKFRGVDYYGIDDLLTEEQRMMRDAVRDWVESRFLPIVGQHHRDGSFPTELSRDLGEMGVFGATLKGYGCAGLDNIAYGLIMQELERGDSGVRSFASVQSGLVMYPIHAFGSDAQKEKFLPRLQRARCSGGEARRARAPAQSGPVMYPIHAFGSDAQKEKFLPRLQRAELIGCFGLTEPDFGSN